MTSFVTRAAIAVGAFLASSIVAHAADLPRYKAPVYTAPAAYDWTGFYVGANAGYAFGTSNVSSTATQTGYYGACPSCVTGFNSASSGSVSPKGFTGGLQFGYNWQFGSFVAGLEADFNYMGLKGSRTGTGSYLPNDPSTVTVNQEVKADWLATLRPRLGYAFNSVLLYGTGGLAATTLKYAVSESDTFVFPASGSGSVSKMMLGWTLGAGLEYAWLRNWTVKAEYLYVKFGSVSFDHSFGNVAVATTIANSADLKTHVARLGVNYRF